jgi:hypothetical protein
VEAGILGELRMEGSRKQPAFAHGDGPAIWEIPEHRDAGTDGLQDGSADYSAMQPEKRGRENGTCFLCTGRISSSSTLRIHNLPLLSLVLNDSLVLPFLMSS